MKKLIAFLGIFIFVYACSNNTVFKEYHKFDDLNWQRLDIINFELDVQQGQLLDFDFLLRHHTQYPYDYLDLNITFYTPSGSTMSRDYHYKLKENGKWKADGMGDYWDIELPIRKELKINKSGKLKVRIENKMPKYDNPGIMEIGLLTRTNE